MSFGALMLRPGHVKRLRALKLKPRPRPVERKSERAEGPLASSARIEKAEMQPCGGGYGDMPHGTISFARAGRG
jgi:hypothetical protein